MTTTTTELPAIADVVERIRAEYIQMPGLCLTKPQMQRLWGLEGIVCAAVVDALVAARVLRETEDGMYVSASVWS